MPSSQRSKIKTNPHKSVARGRNPLPYLLSRFIIITSTASLKICGILGP